MFDESRAAEVMFGGSTEQAAPPAQPAPEPPPVQERTEEEVAETLFGDKTQPVQFDPVSEEVRALRDDPNRRMFSPQETLRSALPDATEAPEGFDLATTNKAMAEAREIAADLDLGPADINVLRTRAGQIQATAPSQESQVEASIVALNARFGSDATQALRDARLLLQRDPRAARLIEGAGLGNDPQTVVMLAERARAQIAAGKLRRPK